MVTVKDNQPNWITQVQLSLSLQSINFQKLNFLPNIPDLTLSDVVIPTPFKPIPVLGQNLTYGNLSITFICR